VLLCHGFASNRFTFDLNPRVSVAEYMARQGWDTWVVELRGSGKSKNTGPSHEGNTSWCFDDHVEDMRAFVEKVYAVSGKPVHVVGHGMGAMLAQCAAAGVRTNARMVRSGVSLAGSFVMPESEWKEFLWLWPVVQTFPTIHPQFIKEILAPMSFRLNTPWDQLFLRHSNIDADVAREVFSKNWEPIPVSLIAQLRSAVDEQGLRSADGKALYADRLGSISAPMLMLAGAKDQQCPPATMQAAASRVAGSTYQCFGAQHGHKRDYGHFDLLVGLSAHQEVWTVVSDFLHQHDDTAADEVRGATAAGQAHDAPVAGRVGMLYEM
jgi:pimeloyl-ACP methyl ester carboxylesterase